MCKEVRSDFEGKICKSELRTGTAEEALYSLCFKSFSRAKYGIICVLDEFAEQSMVFTAFSNVQGSAMISKER